MVSSLELLGFTHPSKLPPPPMWMIKESIFYDNKMVLKDELKKKTVKELRAIVKKYNADVSIRRYSTMKKDDLIEAMLAKEVMSKIKDAPEVKPAPAPTKRPRVEVEIEEDEPVQGPRNLKKGFGIKRMPKKPAPAPTNSVSTSTKRIDLGMFRTHALLPLLVRRGSKEKYWLKNEGEIFADRERDLEKRAKEFKKTATPEEAKAIDLLVKIHKTAIEMKNKGTFKNFGFYQTIMRNKKEINKTLREAKLKVLPRD